ncbi:MAG: ATP-binding protein, partial [Chitinophagaceae bacterium]
MDFVYHEFEGTGIGLSICKKIVEKHNGFITAESKINDGSVFIITLPLKLNLQQETIYNKQA